MKVLKNSKSKHTFFIKLCVLVIIGFFVARIIDQQININAKNKELQQKQEKLQMQEAKNQELREESRRDKDIGEDVKEIARKRLGFAENSEKVIEIS